MRSRSALATLVASTLLSSGFVIATSVSAEAAPKPKAYKNCTELNKVYKHGVGRPGAKDKVSGSTKPVTSFTVSAATYKLNTKSDRDKDGIACEKR
ncbi:MULTISPECIES: excalibur calcium-binding domain-containing protein [unclassified Phycicoccus]|uniref:excalibur calcium-binding domain-containing protein n=1 Tax=unclassified Phycicoccus TaxID=2637926 RepID=UPI000703A5BD|nr:MULTISPECIES: excalibur calcium-binding domain-containing protein [unclassified Phycicoccus]KQU68064.1 calcium-binding protein [Phycicoccus sp. Root101]KQZ90000.1 calcium-binding protein [Phycicoccus sp. Root563]